MKENRIVHALLEGRVLCGFSSDVPANWPPGHVWTQVTDLTNINCPECKRIAEGMRRPEATPSFDQII